MDKGFCNNPYYYEEVKYKKNFLIINIDLLDKLNELKPSSRKIYLKLYDLSQKCKHTTNNPFPELDIRTSFLVKRIGIDRTTVVRGLNELKESGWILKDQKDFHTYKIIVGAPEHHLKDIIENTPDRKDVTEKSKVTTTRSNFKKSSYQKNAVEEINEINDAEELKKETDDSSQQKTNDIYACYLAKVGELIAQGVSRIKAPVEAKKQFSKEEQKVINETIKSEMEYSKNPTANFSSSTVCQNSSKLMHYRKPITIYKNNIFTVNSKFDVSKSHQQNASQKSDKSNAVTKINFDYVCCYLKKLLGRGDIPKQVTSSKKLDEIAYEIYFHVKNRDLNKTKSDFHALNAAISLLKSGKWSTPFELKRQRVNESKQREQEALLYKKLEHQELKSSPVSRILVS